MQRPFLLSAALALLNTAQILGQDATSTANPLHDFINGAQGGAGAINSIASAKSAAATSSSSSALSTSSPATSSASPTAAAATSSAASHHGLSNGAKIGIIVGCVIAAVLLIGILLGCCCCLLVRRRRRSGQAHTPIGEDEKTYHSEPINPGHSYSPVSSHGHHHSIEQHPTVPLMAAGAIPHGRHSQAPSLSQHPAMRNSAQENPFADNVGGAHHHNSHHGLEASMAGAAAAGAAGTALHHRHHSGQYDPTSHAQLKSPAHEGRHSHYGPEPGLASTTASGAGSQSVHHPHQAETPYATRSNQITPRTHNGLNSHSSDNPYRKVGPGSTEAVNAGAMGRGSHHHNQSGSPFSIEGLPPASQGLPHGVPNSAITGSGLEALPSSNNPTSSSHNGLKSGAGGAAIAGAAAYGVHRHEEKKRSQSRSHSRPRSGGLPTRNDADRPPTPFGLSGIGQPYENKHVHTLQGEAPSDELQHSLQSREGQFTSGAPYAPTQTQNRSSKGYSTPPQIPSRSPNRDKRASLFADSSNNSTSSNSGGEQYNQLNDPYQPAHPNRASIPPWEQHQTRYSGTPPTSATISPPPVPWESPEYTQYQRRHSDSPRQRIDASGRRSSRSPATSINGQPRRLRFEDLQPAQVHSIANENPEYDGKHHAYDEYDHARWSQGVGEAI